MKPVKAWLRGAASALALVLTLATTLAIGPAGAKDAAGLGPTNFVDIGDSLTDILDTSGLAFSTMVIGAAATQQTRPHHAIYHTPSRPALAAQAFDSPCPGGGNVKARIRDADASGDLSAEDRFVTVFESCVIEGSVVTGRSEFVVAAHRFEGSVEVTELEFRFKDLGTSDLRWTGPARVVLRTDLRRGTERYLVSYRDLAAVRGPHHMRWNFQLEVVRPPIGDQVASVNGAMTLAEIHLRLRQDEPFVIAGDGFPRSGQLTAGDEHGARLQVEAGRWRYAYRLFSAGNAGERPDATSQSRPHGSH